MRLVDFFSGAAHKMKNVPGSVRRLKVWILIGVFLLLLLVLGPWLDIVFKVISGLWGALLMPVLESPVGRFLFVNSLIVLTLWIVYRRFRVRKWP